MTVQETIGVLKGLQGRVSHSLGKAVAMAIRALEDKAPRETGISGDGEVFCPQCGSGEWLHNEDGNENAYCGQCGQRLDWGDTDGDDITEQ